MRVVLLSFVLSFFYTPKVSDDDDDLKDVRYYSLKRNTKYVHIKKGTLLCA